MPALPSSLISCLSYAPALTVPETADGLPAALANLPDPRARRGVRQRLPVVVTTAVCAVVAGYRSYTAIAEWVADAPDTTVLALGIAPDRRPSEAMIRRLLQAMDPQLLTRRSGPGSPGGCGPRPAPRRPGGRSPSTASRCADLVPPTPPPGM
ncbi:transposase family protein [Actinoplanes sp. CA-030573]|uniref:transposase family protein n=1 Tax=Actinoplanes sp. CA-030573 TaxID=3239898 RepID=UPI003D8B4588